MKIVLYILISTSLLLSCTTEKHVLIEGDLYFKIINYPTFYGAPDSLIFKFVRELETVNKYSLKEQDKEQWNLLKFMYEKKLMEKPYINLKQDNGEIAMLYLDSIDFDKLKNYNHHDLLRENKKIRIITKALPVKYESWNAYENLNIISIKKIDGETEWMK